MENTTKKEQDNVSAETEVVANGVYTHVFAKPWSYEGKEYEKITFYWNKLTGADSIAIEGEIQAMGKALITPEFSGEYLIRMASRSSEPCIGIDVIMAMPISDFNKIRSRARSFLLNLAP